MIKFMLFVLLIMCFGISPINAQWTLVWEDNFDVFDTDNWTKRWPWGSQYADHLPNTWFPDNHVYVKDGNLVIHASGDDAGGREWSSGIVNSRQKVVLTNTCRIVARVNVPSADGCVPAFWLLEDYTDGESLAWPPEIDIYEFAPGKNSADKGKTVWCTVHYKNSQGGNSALGNGGYTFETTRAGEFHDYEIQWFDNQIYWYVDGIQVYHVKNTTAVPDVDMFLLFGMEINDQPGWHGTPEADGWNEYMYVDWVRVYEQDESSVTEKAERLTNFSLEQNFPNPFNPLTSIHYHLSEPGRVKIIVYDMLGQEIANLVNEHQHIGAYTIQWNALDKQGNSVPSGVYFLVMHSGDFVSTRKMALMR